MKPEDLPALDLRSLQLLATVAREESFTRAADALGLNQSVISYNVNKLRQVFDDPLFVRIAGKTRPTERCRAIIVFAQQMTDDIARLRGMNQFDPATTNDRLVIACNYYERMLVVPRILAVLMRAAPNLDIEIVDASGSGHEKLMNRDADLLIGPFQRDDAAFHTRALLTESYSCLMDPGHSLGDQALTMDRYLDLDHILVTYGGRWRSSYVSELDAMGLSLRAAIKIPSPAGIEELVRGSQLVATLPTALARKVAGGLRLCPCPVEAVLSVKLVWTVEQHRSAMLTWVRDVVESVVTTIPDS